MLLIGLTFFANLSNQLELYVSQSAWLYTVPDKAKQPRIKSTIANMPPLDGGAYLVNILFDIGPATPKGMGGLVSITELEISAWQQNRGLRLSCWEAKTIKRLSQIYAGAANEARDPKATAPYIPARTQITREQHERISAAMSAWADKINGQGKPK